MSLPNHELFDPGEVSEVNHTSRADDALLQAQRANAHIRSEAKRYLVDLSESPLFGGKKQGEMF